MAQTLSAEDLTAIVDAIIARADEIHVRIDQSQEVDSTTPPIEGAVFTLADAFRAPCYEAYGDVDIDRGMGVGSKSLPGSGLPPITFQSDDVDRPTFRHRLS